jgi:hypothetical protein
VPYAKAGARGVFVIRDGRHTHRVPRWWVAPPTPAEAPQAKRRTVARWRGTVAVMMVASAAFVVFALLLLLRVGRQVGAGETTAVVLVASIPEAHSIDLPEPVSLPEAGAPSVAPSGRPGIRNRRPTEVFREPGF